jgi:hypothetical protein
MSYFMDWVTHGIKKDSLVLDRSSIARVSGLFIALVLVAVAYLLLASWTAVQGRRIDDLRSHVLDLRRTSEQLAVEIAEETSVDTMWSRVVGLGFAPAEQVEFLGSHPNH